MKDYIYDIYKRNSFDVFLIIAYLDTEKNIIDFCDRTQWASESIHMIHVALWGDRNKVWVGADKAIKRYDRYKSKKGKINN